MSDGMSNSFSPILFFRDAKRHLVPFGSPFGVILNAFLLYMIIKKSTPTMKSFKKVLLLTCISEMIFSAVNIVFVFTLTVQGSTYIALTEGVFGHLPPFWTYVGYDLFLFFIYASVTNATVVFFYRYLTVCRSKILNGYEFCFCVGIGWVLICLYVSVLTYEFVTQPFDPLIHEKLKLAEFSFNESYNNFIYCDVTRFASYSTYGAVPVTTLAYIAVIFMSFAVQRSFKRLRSLLSLEEQRFHGEITLVLWVEAVTPFVTVVLPIYYDIGKLMFTNMPFNWFADFIWLLTILGPSFTAVVKLFSIKSYRDVIIKHVNKISKNNNSTVVHVIQPSISHSAMHASGHNFVRSK